MRLLTAIALTCSLGDLAAQVVVDKPLVLTGSAPAARQVLDLDAAAQPADALDASSEQAGLPHWMGDASLNAWELQLPAISGPPMPGLTVTLRATGIGSGSVSLSLNGSAPFPVLIGPGQPLDGSAVADGAVLALVFDGTSFHVTNGAAHRRRPCLQGMAQAGEHYCIDSLQQAETGTFYEAALQCVENGKRLCTWSEWQQACNQRVQLGLGLMIGDWEWTNSAANEDLGARIVGNTSCTVAGVSLASDTTRSHRCCYSR
ncbi:MAG: hypothetical protein H6591_12820 [Flavobacteriales bacterium]|nr:hypothetical protein [Flavobacteriales bacterium]